MNTTLTLADFLLARVVEDEAVARAATPGPWSKGLLGIGARSTQVACWDCCRQIPDPTGGESQANIAHIARHDPARVLAECEAKRQIIKHATDEFRVAADGYQMLPPILEWLALPYADHPDYRDEWRAA